MPHVEIKPISDIIKDDELLKLRPANGTKIPFEGWVKVSFSQLDPKTKSAGGTKLLMPILVSEGLVEKKNIIGFNAFEELKASNRSSSNEVMNFLRV